MTEDAGQALVNRTYELLMLLPFVQVHNGRIELWPEMISSGDDATDIAEGERYADQAIAIAKEHANEFIIAWILADQTKLGRYDNFIAGFQVRVASVARVGALN